MRCLQIVVLLAELITVDTQVYQSIMNMTNFGFECQSTVSADRLATFTSVLSVVRCASKCNQQPICRYFDYDISSMTCRLFSDGSLVPSNSTTSRAGAVRYTSDLYSSYGQVCTRDNCEINRYLTCNAFNICQCPAGQRPNAQMCVVDKFAYRWNSTGITVAGITGSFGAGASQLYTPEAITLDSSGALYISARDGHRVQKWLPSASSGTTVVGQSSGTFGSALTSLNEPTGLTVDSNGTVYVTDNKNHRVVRWTQGASSGTIVAGTGTSGSANNQLSNPRGVALNPTTGTLYISDNLNHRVMQYLSGATSGTVVAGGNGLGISSTQLSYPRGLYFDSLTNSLVIANAGAHNIVRWLLGASSWTLLAGSSGVSGATSATFSNPSDVVFDSMGNMYVADLSNNRVQFFLAGQSNGTTIAGVTSTPGNTSTLLNAPTGLALDSQLNLYVTDSINHRVQKFLHY